jgi:hypothetical protein
MTSQLNHLVGLEQIADQRRAAERHHLAGVAAKRTRRERSLRIPALRVHRSLLGQRKRYKLT